MFKRTNSRQFRSIGNQISGNIQTNNQNIVSQLSINAFNTVKNVPHKLQSSIKKQSYIDDRSEDNILKNQQNLQKMYTSGLQNSLAAKDIKLSQQMKPKSIQIQYMSGSIKKNGVGYKMPDSIKQSIVKLSSGKKPVGSMTNSKISKVLFDQYRSFQKNSIICDICSCEYEQKLKARLSDCQHVFCDSCLRHYVDYKISRFEQVFCPAQGCEKIIDTKSEFYNSLSPQLKQKYIKVHTFSMVSKNPNTRLCPNQNCNQGILEIQEDVDPKCSKCQKLYCRKCFFAQHAGPCQQNELDFFQNNLHFRQCNQCKRIVQKIVGCNHIKCICGYEFCYLCGAKWWNYQHLCGMQAEIQPQQPQQQPNCCRNILKILLKIFILLPLFLVILLLLICKTLLFIAGLLAVTIILGVLPYTFEYISNRGCPWNLILLILYPFTMLIGLFKSFTQIFCEAIGRVLNYFCQQISSAYECLLQ